MAKKQRNAMALPNLLKDLLLHAPRVPQEPQTLQRLRPSLTLFYIFYSPTAHPRAPFDAHDALLLLPLFYMPFCYLYYLYWSFSLPN